MGPRLCPHREGTKSAERWHRVQAAAAERIRKRALKAELQLAGKALLDARAPADFGIMRMRAWCKAYYRLRSALKYGSLPVLESCVAAMRDVCTMSPESCAQYLESVR